MPSHTDQDVPQAVLEAFHSPRAQPRVRWVYTPHGGMQWLKPKPVLTTRLALQLRADGVSRIELEWRLRRVKMRVTSGEHSVWGKEGPPPAGPSATEATAAPPSDESVSAA